MKINLIRVPFTIIKRLRITSFSAMFLLIANNSYGQEDRYDPGQLLKIIPENILNVSPSVAQFQKVNFMNSNHYSGKLQVNIPLYTIEVGDLKIPISLDYNTTGVKVDDQGGDVGINWSLNYGGSIIRNIKDLPDNEVGYAAAYIADYYSGDVRIRPAASAMGFNRKGSISMETSLRWGIPSQIHATYTENIRDNVNRTSFWNSEDQSAHGSNYDHTDIYPDIFSVFAPGLSTSFISINNTTNDIYPNNNSLETYFLDNSQNKMLVNSIDRVENIGLGFAYEFGSDKIYPGNLDHYSRSDMPLKDFLKFSILSPNGIQYDFNDYEINETFHFPYFEMSSSPILGDNRTYATMFSNNYNKRIDNWLLTKMKDVKTNREISYEYESYSNNKMIELNSVNQLQIVPGYSEVYANRCDYDNFTQDLNSSSFSKTFSHVQKRNLGRRIKKITYDYGVVDFFYEDRADALGEKRISSIKVSEGLNEIFYDFSYEIVVSKNEVKNDENSKRNFLRKVEKRINGKRELIAEFSYKLPNLLPRKGSLQQDYLGYFNNNGFTSVQGIKNSYIPKLYFYQKNKEYSLLPFKRKDIAGVDVNGDFTLEPNENSLIGLLSDIRYPTGGRLEIGYENNSFIYQNNEYIGPGTRVAWQKLTEGNIVKNKINYTYNDSKNKTTGFINNIPVFGYVNKLTHTPLSFQTFSIYDKSKTNIELSAGNYIGYGEVTEKIEGQGKMVNYYYTPRDFPNFKEVKTGVTPCEIAMLENSAFPISGYSDISYKQGALKGTKYFDEASKELENIEYQFKDINTKELKFAGVTLLRESYQRQDHDPKFKFLISGSYKWGTFSLSKQIIQMKTSNGTSTSEHSFEYDDKSLLTETSLTTSNGKILKEKFYRINKVNDSSYDLLRTQNRFSEILKSEKYIDNKLLEQNVVQYSNFSNNILPSKVVKTIDGKSRTLVEILSRDSKGNIKSAIESDNVIKSYIWDNKGQFPIGKAVNSNMSEFTMLDVGADGKLFCNHISSVPLGVSVVPDATFGKAIEVRPTNGIIQLNNNLNASATYELLFWESGSDLGIKTPTASILSNIILSKKGSWNRRKITFTSVQGSLVLNVTKGFIKEVSIYNANAQISTFSFQPLIGMNKKIDVRGVQQTFNYDSFNKLRAIRDHDDNVLTSYFYNYKNQIYDHNGKLRIPANAYVTNLAYLPSINGPGTILCSSKDTEDYYFINANNMVDPPIVVGTILYNINGQSARQGYYSDGGRIISVTQGGKVTSFTDCNTVFQTVEIEW